MKRVGKPRHRWANPRGRETGSERRAGKPTDRRYSSQGVSERARERSESKSQLGERGFRFFGCPPTADR
jgi:hypothetical protein